MKISKSSIDLAPEELANCVIVFGMRPKADSRIWFVNEVKINDRGFELRLSCNSTTRRSRTERVVLDQSKSDGVGFSKDKKILKWRYGKRLVNLFIRDLDTETNQFAFAT